MGDTNIVFVPARFTFGAVKEALYAGIKNTCIITENVPVFDILRLIEMAKERDSHIIGPNCPGILIPNKIKLGIMPEDMCYFGNVAVISKSGTLNKNYFAKGNDS